MPTTILLRGGTASEWTTADPVLAFREVGLETDTERKKVGDGSTAWSSLPYYDQGLSAALDAAATDDLLGVAADGTVKKVDSGTFGEAFALRSGFWYGRQPDGNADGADGWAWANPLWVPKPTTLDRIACEVTTAGESGSELRLGLYGTNASGGPEPLLLDAGTVAGDSTGIKTITISHEVSGLVWLVIAMQNCPTTSPTVKSASGLFNPYMYTHDNAFDSNRRQGGFDTGISGALPNSLSPGSGGTVSRVVQVRVA